MRITKFKIESTIPEDETFLMTRETKVQTVNKITQEVDDVGNIISARRAPQEHPTINETFEKITAVGVQSGEEAKVIVLETDIGPTDEGVADLRDSSERLRPQKINDIMKGSIKKINPDNLFS